MFRFAGLVFGLLAFGGCVVEQSVDLIVRGDGSPARAEATVVVMVTTGACPSLDEALRGPPVETVVYAEQAALGSDLPAVGMLEDRDYAFTAFFLDDACSVTRHGCAVKHSLLDTIEIEVSDVSVATVASCPEGTRCRGGFCVPGVASDCSTDGGACILGAGEDGVCCRGSCTAASGGTCGVLACGDTDSDSANCGECEHVCPAMLSCSVGLCRATPQPTTLTVEVEDPSGATATGPVLVAYAWQFPSIAGPTTGGILDVTHSRPIGGADGDPSGLVELPLPTVGELAELRIWTDLVSEPLAFATIVVATDSNGDAMLDVSEVDGSDATTPEVFGMVEDLAIVASMADVGRTGAVATLLPEGVGVGALPYRVNAEGTALLPTSDTVVRPRMCASDAACVAGLQNPLTR